MSKLLAILLGLFALILAYYCVTNHSPKIQNDLVNRTTQNLTEQNSAFAQVSADGRELVLTGIAPDQAAKDRAGEIAMNVSGVRTVDNQLTIASSLAVAEEPMPEVVEEAAEPEVVTEEVYTDYVVKDPEPLNTLPAMAFPTAPSPFKTDIKMQEGKVTLSGHVPDLSSKLWLVEQAKNLYGTDNVVDELKVAYGAPAGWHNSMDAALTSIGSLAGGTANLADTELSISGHASSARVADQITASITEGIGLGFTSKIDITADELAPVPEYIVQEPQPLDSEPAMTMSVPDQYSTQFTYADKKLTLSGSVPDQSAKMWVRQLAEKAVGESNVIDRLAVEYAAPQGWHAAVSASLGELSSLETGKAELKGQQLSVSGEAASKAIKRKVEQTIERGVSAYQTSYAITYSQESEPTPAPVVSCQDQFNTELSGNKILFNTDEAVIKTDSYALLDRLIQVARACPNSAIEISGHTDDRGPEAYNQWLSESRAKAVVAYLKKMGVSNELSAVGYGEMKPIAANDTDAGMAKNRRIEFNVKGN